MAFVLAAVCAFCIIGCGSDRDWSEEKGELVKAGKSQSFFVLDRKVRDCYNEFIVKKEINRRRTNESKRGFDACVQYSFRVRDRVFF